MIEQQVYRKLVTFKSKQTGKYVCYEPLFGHFILKNLNELNKYCVFIYKIKSQNQYRYSIGSVIAAPSNHHHHHHHHRQPSTTISTLITYKNIHFSFNKFGRMLNFNYPESNNYECTNDESNIFEVHTKLTDIVIDRFLPPAPITTTTTTTTSTTTTARTLMRPAITAYSRVTMSQYANPPLTRQLITYPIMRPMPLVVDNRDHVNESRVERKFARRFKQKRNKKKPASRHVQRARKLKSSSNESSNNENLFVKLKSRRKL